MHTPILHILMTHPPSWDIMAQFFFVNWTGLGLDRRPPPQRLYVESRALNNSATVLGLSQMYEQNTSKAARSSSKKPNTTLV